MNHTDRTASIASSPQSARTALAIGNTSAFTFAASKPATAEQLRRDSAQSLCDMPSLAPQREWGGFSEYEIEYGMRAMGGL